MDYKIELPVIPLVALDLMGQPQGMIEVNESSPPVLLECLEQFARYFQREERYDVIQFTAGEVNNPSAPFRGFLFAESGLNHMKDEHSRSTPSLMVGGGCFRYRRYKNEGKRAVLDWIWLQPYERKKATLSRYWPQLRELANDDCGFLIEPPISKALRAFLKKNSHKDALDPQVIEYLNKTTE